MSLDIKSRYFVVELEPDWGPWGSEGGEGGLVWCREGGCRRALRARTVLVGGHIPQYSCVGIHVVYMGAAALRGVLRYRASAAGQRCEAGEGGNGLRSRKIRLPRVGAETQPPTDCATPR